MTTALIDGDALVYAIGFSTEDTSLEFAIARMRRTLDTLAFVGAGADSYLGFLTGRGEQFRHRVATRAPYKGNRVLPKPVHYEGLREYLATRESFEVAVDQEADDLLAIALTEMGDSAICCSLDKDLDQVPGWHYNWRRRERYWISPAHGLLNFYRQILTGDRIDNIPGVDGIGSGLAEKILPCPEPEEDMAAKTMLAYGFADLTEADWLEAGTLLYLRRKPGDIWTPPL